MKYCRSFFIIYLFLICVFNFSYGQNHNEKWYNTDQYLPQNSIKDITKDKYGFLWMTTDNGIVRFDGNTFLPFNNFQNINNNNFNFFFGNREKDSIFTRNAYQENLILINKRAAILAQNHKILNNTKTKNNLKYIRLVKNGILHKIDANFNYYIKINNYCYFLDPNSILVRNNNFEKIVNLPFNLNNLNSLFSVNNFLFYVHQNKVFGIQGDKAFSVKWDPIIVNPKSKIYWSQINNQCFVVYNDDIFRVLLLKDKLGVQKIAHFNDFDKFGFNSIFYDQDYDNLFLGSLTKGLCVLDIHQFSVAKKINTSFWDSVFYSFLPWDNHSVITTNGDVFDKNGWVKNLNVIPADKKFITQDLSGNIIRKNNNVLYINYKKNGFQKMDSIAFPLPIGCVWIDTDNKYYISQNNPDNGASLMVFENNDFKTAKRIFNFKKTIVAINKPNKDFLLIGTRDGLFEISLLDNKISKINKNINFFVQNISIGKNGISWVSTLNHGFFLYKNHQISQMPFDKDNHLKTTHLITEDHLGFLWIATNNGLFRIHRNELLKYDKNYHYKVNYYRYTKENGFYTNEFTVGNNAFTYLLKDGEMALPSLDGIVFFNPNHIKSYYPINNFYVERSVSDRVSHSFNEVLSLKNNFGRVDVFVDVPYFANQENVILEAKLNHQNWEKIGPDRKISFTNLQHGLHTLNIRLLNSPNGKFIYKSVSLEIEPLFYQTLWFKIIAFWFVLIGIYWGIKLRLRFLKLRNKELQKLVNDRTDALRKNLENLQIAELKLKKESLQQKKLISTISHDITTPIKYLSLTAKRLYETDDDNVKLKKNYLESLHNSTLQLYNFTKTLKEYADIYNEDRKLETDFYPVFNLIEEKKMLFNEIALDKNSTIINRVNLNVKTNISKNILSPILQNLMDNAVKNTLNGEIVCEASCYNQSLSIVIKDTGNGFDEQIKQYYENLQLNIENENLLLQKYGLGLHLVIQLLQMINGKIYFNENNPKGSLVEIIINLNNEKKNINS